MKRDLSEQASAEPDLPELCAEFHRAVEGRDRNVFARQRLNTNARYCLWPHQSADGKKWKADSGKTVFPWPGASDARVPLVDKYINEDVAFLMVISDRMKVQVNGTESNDAAFAHRLTNLLRWQKATQMGELPRERRLGANYLLERGAVVFGVFWDRREQLGYETIDLETITALAMQARQVQEQAQAQGAPSGGGPEAVLATLPNLIMDPVLEKEAALVLQQGFPTVRLSRLRTAVRELRAQGTTRLPRPKIVKDQPCVVALSPNDDIFLPPEATDIQTTPALWRREWLSETQLVARERSHGWSKAWIKEMLRTQKGHSHVLPGQQYGGPSRNQNTGLETETMFEVIHAYRRMHDADGVPGIYYTCFSPGLTKHYAWHGLLDYDHGEYPFVFIERETIARRLDAARGYGEIAFTAQQQVKTEWDSRIDRASIATMPPSYHPPGQPPSKWGPGVKIPVISREDYGFLETPKYDGGSEEVEASVRRLADEYFGRPVDEQNAVQAQLMRQDLANNWMNGLALVDTQLLKLDQQFLPEEIYFRVVGSSQSQPLRATSAEIQGSFDVSVGYNVGDLDNEVVTAKLGLIEKALMMDTTGRVDRNQALDVVFSLIDPDIGERILKPALDASQSEIEDEQTVYARMFAGVDQDVKPSGQAYDLRLKVLENILAQSREGQEKLQQDPAFRARVEKRFKQLGFQMEQRENAIIGRLGA